MKYVFKLNEDDSSVQQEFNPKSIMSWHKDKSKGFED